MMKEVKKEMKKIVEYIKESKKKERNWEVRVRILEAKYEEIDTRIRELKEIIENRDKEERIRDRENVMSQEGASSRRKSFGGSIYTEGSDDRHNQCKRDGKNKEMDDR